MISYWIRIWSVLVISLDQNMCTGCPKIRTNYWIYSTRRKEQNSRKKEQNSRKKGTKLKKRGTKLKKKVQHLQSSGSGSSYPPCSLRPSYDL